MDVLAGDDGVCVMIPSMGPTLIDAHVHVWTDDIATYPQLRAAPAGAPRVFTPEDFFGHASRQGVGRAVLVQVSFYGFDNSYLTNILQRYPGKFSGIGRVDENGADPTAAMIKLQALGCRGFRVVSAGVAAQWLDTPGMAAMWRCAAERRLPICTLIDPSVLPALHRMCARHPATPVVIDHLARIGMDGNPREADIALLCSFARHKNVYVKVSAFHALDPHGPPYTAVLPTIRRVYEAFGAARLMWGSDSPFQVQREHTYQASVSLIARIRMPESDRDFLMRGTAERLFFTPDQH